MPVIVQKYGGTSVGDVDRIRAMHAATNGLVITSAGTLAVGVTFVAVGF